MRIKPQPTRPVGGARTMEVFDRVIPEGVEVTDSMLAGAVLYQALLCFFGRAFNIRVAAFADALLTYRREYAEWLQNHPLGVETYPRRVTLFGKEIPGLTWLRDICLEAEVDGVRNLYLPGSMYAEIARAGSEHTTRQAAQAILEYRKAEVEAQTVLYDKLVTLSACAATEADRSDTGLEPLQSGLGWYRWMGVRHGH